MEEYSRNWASIAAYAIAGVEMALLDIKGKALGVPVAELLGGISRSTVPVIGYLFIDEPEANAAKAADFVAAGHTELKLKVGRDLTQDHDTVAAIRERVGPDVKIRIDANMNWSVPAAIKWIRALEQYDLQYVEQPVPDFDIAGMAQVRRAVATPIAADESCTSVRSAVELIKADACDVFVVYPSEAGGLTRALQIGALAARRASGARSAAGPSSASRPRRTPTSRGVAELRLRQRHALSAAARATSSTSRSRSRAAGSRSPPSPASASRSIPSRSRRSAALELRESPFYDDIRGDAPRVGQIL